MMIDDRIASDPIKPVLNSLGLNQSIEPRMNFDEYILKNIFSHIRVTDAATNKAQQLVVIVLPDSLRSLHISNTILQFVSSTGQR